MLDLSKFEKIWHISSVYTFLIDVFKPRLKNPLSITIVDGQGNKISEHRFPRKSSRNGIVSKINIVLFDISAS